MTDYLLSFSSLELMLWHYVYVLLGYHSSFTTVSSGRIHSKYSQEKLPKAPAFSVFVPTYRSGMEGHHAHLKQNVKSTLCSCVGGVRLCKFLTQKDILVEAVADSSTMV